MERPQRRPWYTHLYLQVVLAFALGALLGWLEIKGYIWAGTGEALKPLADIFVKLIRMLLAPIIFGTVIVGISQMGSLKDLGRIGIKAIVYFEIVTTLALVIGLFVVNLVRPGEGIHANAHSLDASSVATYQTAGKEQAAGGVSAFILNIIPGSVAEAFVSGNMLQIILFAVLLGVALAMLPDRGRPFIEILEVLIQGLFKIVQFIMVLAPLAALGATAFTISKFGTATLKSYGMVVLCVYATSIVFILLVLGAVAWMNGISIWRFLVYIKDEILITFATASSESVFPRMLEKLERMGCKRTIVGLVLPAGYTFNADGSCIYMTIGAIFLAQATDTPLPLTDQIVLLIVCLFTSKGSAGVTGAGFIALAATLTSMRSIPAASLVLLLGVDRFLSEARAVTNMIGNGIATVAVSRWEKAFDREKAHAVLAGNVPPPQPPIEKAMARETGEAGH